MNTNPIKIAAIGDSIIYGYPYEPAASWFNLAAERLNIAYINQGINGDTTDGMLSRFESDILRHKPSHVIILGGTNDAYAGVAVDQVINNIQAMVHLALDNSILPVIVLPIPCHELAKEKLLGQYREAMRQSARENNIEIIDFYKFIVDDSGLSIKAGLHFDGIHPNNTGYEVMAGVAAKTFIRVLIDTRVHTYYWDEDISCIITTLKILSEIFHFKLHPQVFEAAYGLNAGRIGSQCGLVEGALLFIGIYGHEKGLHLKILLCYAISFPVNFKIHLVVCYARN